MRKAIIIIMTLALIILCCTAAQAADATLVNGNGVEIRITKITVEVFDTDYPRIEMKLHGVNSTDRNLYITFEKSKMNGVELNDWYAQGLEPNEEKDLFWSISPYPADDKIKKAMQEGKQLESYVEVKATDNYEVIIGETVTVDLPGSKSSSTSTSNSTIGSPTTSTSGSTSVKAGDVIKFGQYDLDGDISNGSESIEWQVLDVSGNQALVISKLGLFNAKYCEHSKGQYWEQSDLRNTLNSSFYNEAFTPAEKEAIQLTHVDNSEAQADPSALSHRGYGYDTDDYLFILSYGEIVRYLPTQNDRVCEISKIGEKKGLYGTKRIFGMRTCNYWLRHPVFKQNAGAVSWSGTIESAYMNYNGCMVRPCCWVNLNKLGY